MIASATGTLHFTAVPPSISPDRPPRSHQEGTSRRDRRHLTVLRTAGTTSASERPVAASGLLHHLASGGGPSLGDVADELRLSRGELGDPVDVAGSRTALDRACDCLQRLLVARQRGLARLLARFDDPLVELAKSLRGTGIARYDKWDFNRLPTHTAANDELFTALAEGLGKKTGAMDLGFGWSVRDALRLDRAELIDAYRELEPVYRIVTAVV